ncbi:hypothetical protein EVAR_83362_1 [Eumeta japonica]|uniref:Uncharacterized protein n=1 Tax=Eumeta variegata TaxID=151549 RepID=A0A4C1TYH1_EUMVA|nr:hypothetical protein EVAR_83362_1 [Eumeta japonica]
MSSPLLIARKAVTALVYGRRPASEVQALYVLFDFGNHAQTARVYSSDGRRGRDGLRRATQKAKARGNRALQIRTRLRRQYLISHISHIKLNPSGHQLVSALRARIGAGGIGSGAPGYGWRRI